MKAKLVVLISGGGTNLQAILDACAAGALAAQVSAVISDQPEAGGLVRARKAGVEALAFPKLKSETRQEYDARLAERVASFAPDYIVLAGWMRLLSNAFLARFPGRVINLHPALPGTFPGTHSIQRAWESFQRGEIDHSGVMVHYVPDEGMDNGPVIAQRDIFFTPGETLEQFEVRVHQVEHDLLVRALQSLISK